AEVQEDTNIQIRTSDDTELVIEEEEPTKVVEDQGSGESEKETNEEERQQIAKDAEIAKQLQEDIHGASQEQEKLIVVAEADPTKDKVYEFVPMDSELEILRLKRKDEQVKKECSKKEGSRKKSLARKRAGEKLSKEGDKRQKTEYEKEKDELRLSLKITPNDDSEVYYEPLSRKYPIISWEYLLLGRIDDQDKEVYKLTRSDGSSSYHEDIQAFVRRLDRQDLNDLYSLVQERFQTTSLEGHDLILWGDLKMIFDPDESNEIWMNQQDWKLMKWKLHENCEVHTLFMWNTPMEINMLVKKRVPSDQGNFEEDVDVAVKS
ncbi:hypothetical protein Tco_0575032, partial [Tanacetum coccineum]